jgi:mediator of RNA polymerase II transcription subunit 25
MYSSGTEGLAMALNIFDKLDSKREKVQELPIESSRFVIYVANSPPYELPVEYVPKYIGWKMEDLLKKFVESKIKMSMLSPRKIPVLFRLFREAGGDISKFKEKNYARDPKHLVILNGYELQSLPLIQPNTQPPVPAPSQELPNLAITTQPQPVNIPSPAQSQVLATNAKLGIPSQNSNILQQPIVSASNVSSTVSLTGSPGAAITAVQSPSLVPGANANVQNVQGPQRQIMNPRITNVNITRGPRPQNQQWTNQTNPNSPSDILRKQLTNQAANKGLPNPVTQKQPQLQKTQVPKPTMTSQGIRQGSPQSVKQGPGKTMPGKSLPSPQQKPEPDSSVGISSTSTASVPMQLGSHITTNVNTMGGMNPNQQKAQNSTLVTLLNQGPIIRQNPPQATATSAGSNLRAQLIQRPQNVATAGRIINPQGQQTMVSRQPVPVVQNQPGAMPAQASAIDPQNQGIESRKVIWTGELQWKENSKVEPNTNKKMEHTVVCSVTSKKDDNGMPEVKPDNWPPKLIMQLIPKTLVQKLGGHFFNHSRSVLFHPQKSESLDILTRVLGTGYAGCVVRKR